MTVATDFNIPTLIVGAVIFWLLITLMRRPKKSPPGPWGVPVFGCLPRLLFTRKRSRDVFNDWYHKYGPIYNLRMGSANVVVLNTIESIQDALTRPEFQDRPKLDFSLAKKGEGVSLSNGKVWQEQRRFVHQIFRNFGVGKSSFENAIVEEAEFLTETLLQKDGKVANIENHLKRAVANVISSVTVGKRFTYDDEYFQNVLAKINDMLDHSMIASQLSLFLPFIKYIPFSSSAKIVESMETLLNFHDRMTTEHQANFDADNMKDIMDAYMFEIKKGNKDALNIFNEDNLYWVINDLFIGSTDSVTTTLLWAFLFLLNNPDVEEKVRAQLNDVVGRNRMPRYSDRPKLPLVEAIISETLRLGTMASISLPRVLASNCELRGFIIPKGTIIIPNVYAIFSDENKWDEPENFRPERFLDEKGNFIKRDDFIPFGTGRRLCIGEQLARMELFIFLTHILQKMSFSVPDGERTPTAEGIDGMIHKPKTYKVQISKRTD